MDQYTDSEVLSAYWRAYHACGLHVRNVETVTSRAAYNVSPDAGDTLQRAGITNENEGQICPDTRQMSRDIWHIEYFLAQLE